MSWLYPFASSSSSHRHRSHSKDPYYYSSSSRHRSSSRNPSLFSLGASANRSSASSIFSGVSGFSSSSRSRARSRSGFISRMVRKIKRIFRRIMHYAQRHPMRVFFLVVLPLITGGVLQKLLGVVGLRVPHSLQQAASGSRDFGDFGGGGEGAINGLVSLAKMFA